MNSPCPASLHVSLPRLCFAVVAMHRTQSLFVCWLRLTYGSLPSFVVLLGSRPWFLLAVTAGLLPLKMVCMFLGWVLCRLVSLGRERLFCSMSSVHLSINLWTETEQCSADVLWAGPNFGSGRLGPRCLSVRPRHLVQIRHLASGKLSASLLGALCYVGWYR